MPRIGGRQKDPFNEISWAPPVKYYKHVESVEINTFARRNKDRLIQGYVDLFKAAHGKDPEPHHMKYIHKVIKGIDL